MLEILLADDEPELRDVLQELLLEAGHQVVTASDGAAGADYIKRRLFDVVICDVRLPQLDGLTLFRRIRKEAPGTEVILMTAYLEVSQAVSPLKEGAYDYLTKPFDMDELLLQVRRLDEIRTLRRELDEARQAQVDGSSATTLVGMSPAIRRIHEMTKLVAQSDAPTMVTGETSNDTRPLQAAVRDFEHAYLLRALRATEGKRARSVQLLGISRKTLWEKLRGGSGPRPSDVRAWAPYAGVGSS
jgi:two-component system, NtrC family, response regulator AtoC